jgi:hypothetical protein
MRIDNGKGEEGVLGYVGRVVKKKGVLNRKLKILT